jgi:hypothetical protein
MKVFALAFCACLAAAPAARAEVQLSLRDGRVTIIAKDATIRQILAEWARVGKTKIVNAERIPGGPVTLELKDVPEAEALDVLLRTLSGYIAAPRSALMPPDASVFDSISVMPSIASAAPRTAGPSNSPPPFAPPPVFNQTEDDQDNPGLVRPGGAPPQNGRGNIFTTFPAPQNGNGNGARAPMLPVVRPGGVAQPQQNGNPEPQQQPVQAPPAVAAPTASPGGFVGTSAPGVVPPAASQPGQIVQPQRPPSE